jgi:hypothetical protein
MSQDALSGPDLAGVIADAGAAGLEHVVIGGFSVIFHGYVRATRDSDLLVPDGEDADNAILRFFELAQARRLSDGKRLTIDDVDFATVSERADTTEWEGQLVRVAALPSVVGFKRLARRPQDRVDLEELQAIHGELPEEPIPGLDTES